MLVVLDLESQVTGLGSGVTGVTGLGSGVTGVTGLGSGVTGVTGFGSGVGVVLVLAPHRSLDHYRLSSNIPFFWSVVNAFCS